MKYIERVANLAIIVAVVVFLVVVVRGDLLRRSSSGPAATRALIGSTVRLPGVQFPAQRDSLLLGISATCHFCKASLPFYKQLAAQLQGKVDVIAVLPQTQAEGESFIKDAGLNGVRVVSAKLGTIGVYGTPTVLLVDNNGKVKSAWVGQLDNARQQQLIGAVLPKGATAVPRS